MTNKKIEARLKRNLMAADKKYKQMKILSSVGWASGWEKFIVNKKDARVTIRCQHRIKNEPPTQCGRAAIRGMLVCIKHKGRRGSVKDKIVKGIREDLGIYDVKKAGWLHRQLEEMKDIPEEKLEGLQDELKMGVALLRQYLKNADDKDIMKSPGRLLWILDNIVRFKSAHWQMKHAKEVSFTRDQVEYLFVRVRMIIVNVIKDTSAIQKISDEIQTLGITLKQEGFKNG